MFVDGAVLRDAGALPARAWCRDTLRDLIALNPLAPLFELARMWIIDPSAPTPGRRGGRGVRLVVPVAIYVAVCVLAVWVFRREAPRIAEEL